MLPVRPSLLKSYRRPATVVNHLNTNYEDENDLNRPLLVFIIWGWISQTGFTARHRPNLNPSSSTPHFESHSASRSVILELQRSKASFSGRGSGETQTQGIPFKYVLHVLDDHHLDTAVGRRC